MTRDEQGATRGLATAFAAVVNAVTAATDAARNALPGRRPQRIVIELRGSFPALREARPFPARLVRVTPPVMSLEELDRLVESLLRADWLRAVAFRFTELNLSLTAATAVRRQFARLRAAGKRVEVIATAFDNASYYLASAADRITAPPSAEFQVTGLALTATFLGDSLGRAGVRFEKVAVGEYKNAGDELVRTRMSEAQREQYGAYLDSVVATTHAAIGHDRGRPPEAVAAWVDAGVTSAAQAAELGMLDAVAYEDEALDAAARPVAAARRYLPGRRLATRADRVALVGLEGVIVTGQSRSSPLPLPVVGRRTAGSETLVGALRAAGRDARTRAVVLHVESGGGSALASDLIGREVELLARRMPVVAVMGAVAASGGYYVLTHATRVLAEATTLTGSIGVLTMKPVLEELYARYGANVESLERGRFAGLMATHRPFDGHERALLERYTEEVYGRFVARVAAGRRLDEKSVDEIGRGRIWSGADALERGLVDELGGVPQALDRARELAGLPPDAAVWRVPAPARYVLPTAEDPTTILRTFGAGLRERAWLLHPAHLAVR